MYRDLLKNNPQNIALVPEKLIMSEKGEYTDFGETVIHNLYVLYYYSTILSNSASCDACPSFGLTQEYINQIRKLALQMEDKKIAEQLHPFESREVCILKKAKEIEQEKTKREWIEKTSLVGLTTSGFCFIVFIVYKFL
jgi:hypothetical protein